MSLREAECSVQLVSLSVSIRNDDSNVTTMLIAKNGGRDVIVMVCCALQFTFAATHLFGGEEDGEDNDLQCWEYI